MNRLSSNFFVCEKVIWRDLWKDTFY